MVTNLPNNPTTQQPNNPTTQQPNNPRLAGSSTHHPNPWLSEAEQSTAMYDPDTIVSLLGK